MKTIKILRTVLLALAFSGLAAGSVQASSHGGKAAGHDQAAEFKQAVDKAEAARKKAASVGGEWRDTGKFIKKAKAAAKKGEYAEAMKLANKAYRQGELGYQQAMGQKNADFPSYMHMH